MKKAILAFIALTFMSLGAVGNAGIINIGGSGDSEKPNSIEKIKNTAYELKTDKTSVEDVVNGAGKGLLSGMKLIISGLIVVYLVYNGAMMIMSNGTDDDALSKSKRQFSYAAVGLFFINIPGTILSSVFNESGAGRKTVLSDTDGFADGHSIIVTETFNNTIQTNLIGFLQVIISAIAIGGIMISGIQMLVGRGNDDKVSKLKSRIIYSSFALVLVGIIESFKQIVFLSDFQGGTDLFGTLANLTLYFAAPVAVTFLIYAGYQLITSNGDEQKMNNAKTIVTNVLLAVLIVLSSGAILAELDF